MKEEEMKNRGIGWHEYGNVQASRGKSYFLGIGIDEYQDEKHFPKLDNAVLDMETIAAFCFEHYQFDEIRTLRNREATKGGILEEFYRLYGKLEKEDRLLIYFSGHGGKKSFTKHSILGFWAVHNSEGDLFSSHLTNSEVKTHLDDLKNRHILLISDSCFSGTFLKTRSQKESNKDLADIALAKKEEMCPSRWGLCSGRHDQEVADGAPGEHSPFARAILRVLRENIGSHINTRYFVDRVISYTNYNYQGQLVVGNPLMGPSHKGGAVHFLAKRNSG